MPEIPTDKLRVSNNTSSTMTTSSSSCSTRGTSGSVAPPVNGDTQKVSIENPARSKSLRYERLLHGRYQLRRTIGTGNFAKVKLATHVVTGVDVAIKIIDKTQLSASSQKKLSREVNLMRGLDHPNIVKLIEIIDTEKLMYLVLEYAERGELYDYLSSNGRMNEKMAREKFRQMLSAVEYCHQKNIIHRDLKTENLLLDANMNIKLADFGFANEYQRGKKLNTFCGSPPYAAPELFRGKEYEGPEVDVWSLGVILFKLVTGNLPFDGQNLPELRERVLQGRYRIPFYMSTGCENLLKKMLKLTPSKRHNLRSIMTDPWVNLSYDNDPLVSYVEPEADKLDPERVKVLMKLGFPLDRIYSSYRNRNYDDITATYTLLDKSTSAFCKKTNSKNETSKSDTDSLTPTPGTDTVTGNKGPSCTVPEDVTIHPWPKDDEKANNLVPPVMQNGDRVGRNSPKVPSNEPVDDFVRVITIQRPSETTTSEDPSRKTEKVPSGRERKNATRPLTAYEIICTPKDLPNGKESILDPLSRSPWNPAQNPPSVPVVGDFRSGIVKSANKGGLLRTVSFRTNKPGEKREPGRIRIITDTQPSGTHNKFDEPHGRPDVKQNPVIIVGQRPTNIAPPPPPSPSTFSRRDPTRKTLHSTYRADEEVEPLEVIHGVANNKTSAGPYTNLTKIDSDDSSSPTVGLDEDRPIPPQGLQRSVTVRVQTGASKPMTRNNAIHVESISRPNTTINPITSLNPDNEGKLNNTKPPIKENPSSPKRPLKIHIDRRSRRYSKQSPVNSESTSSKISNDEPNGDSNGIGSVNFFQAVAMRFSLRKPTPTKSNASQGSDIHSPSPEPKPRVSVNRTVKIDAYKSQADSITPVHNGSGIIHSDYALPRSEPQKVQQQNALTDPTLNYVIDAEQKPRKFRFTWSMKATSSLTPDELVREIKRVLIDNQYGFQQQQKYLFTCDDRSVNWEVEVCGIPRLNMQGIRFKKVNGTSVNYRSVVTKMLNELHI